VATLSDSIEKYLKGRLSRAVEGVIEIRRSEVAEQFDCVPSQINYVLETRFTPQRGYYVESRRGGGGYIRIMQIYVRQSQSAWESVCEEIGNRISAERAESLVARLEEIGALSPRRALLIRGALRHETSEIGPPWDDVVRAKLLKSMLMLVFHDGG